MIEKRPLCPERVRKISGSFAFIEHRFLREGFWATLSPKELVLYVFFILVADRHGLSYYSFDKICSLLEFSLDDLSLSRLNHRLPRGQAHPEVVQGTAEFHH
jgi:hypothetical protein